MARKQFSFYRPFFETIEKLPTMKAKVQAYELLCAYALDETEPDLSDKSQAVATVFRLMRPNLEAAHRRSRVAVNRTMLTARAGIKQEHELAQQDAEEVLV